MMEFSETVCVVTGGERGIGKAIVEMFEAEGAEVHSIDFAQQDENSTGTVHQHNCDISNLVAVEKLFGKLDQEGKSIDVLVNNAAAVTRAAPITELSLDEWNKTINVNITGAFNVTRSAIPLMGVGGRIINIASTFAHVGAPGRVAYSTSKGAILAFTRSLALDLAASRIRVNSISPGAIATERLIEHFGSRDAAEEILSPLHPIGHTGRARDIADAVWFLASSKSTFMTGADMLVDGGYTAQ